MRSAKTGREPQALDTEALQTTDQEGLDGMEHTMRDALEPKKILNEGELLHFAISRKREEIACTNCGSVGTMATNGGSGQTMRSWRCK